MNHRESADTKKRRLLSDAQQKYDQELKARGLLPMGQAEHTPTQTTQTFEEEWAAKSYRLYCIGLSPFTDKVSSLRILQDDKIIKAHTRSNIFKIRYENLHLYDDENVEGVSLERKLLHYRVIDWFDCQGLYDLNFEKLTTEDKFVNKVLLFKSRRIDGNQKYLDLLCESFLTTEQLKNFDYGDTMVRFKVSKLLKDSGLNRFKLHFWKRDAYPIYETIY